MGGLFSSSPAPPPPQRTSYDVERLRARIEEQRRQEILENYARQQQLARYARQQGENFQRPFHDYDDDSDEYEGNLSYSGSNRTFQQQIQVTRTLPKAEKLGPNHRFIASLSQNRQVDVTYTTLDEYVDWNEFHKIRGMITNKRRFKLDRIDRVNNPLLRAAYDLKKQEKLVVNRKLQERWLFHGTSKTNLDNICTMNFDWRRAGSNVGHRFGRGISFSPNVNYASNYSDKHEHTKVMIVAFVLINDSCIGTKGMVIPPNGYDTSHKESGMVIVKYDDNEFYPAYVLYYHLNLRQSENEDSD